MALNEVIELIAITTPNGVVRINTAGRDIVYGGETFYGKGIEISELTVNGPNGANPGGVSIVIVGLTTQYSQDVLEDNGWGFESVHTILGDGRKLWEVRGRMSDTVLSSGRFSADIEPIFSFLKPTNQKYAGYSGDNFGDEIERNPEEPSLD